MSQPVACIVVPELREEDPPRVKACAVRPWNWSLARRGRLKVQCLGVVWFMKQEE